jgi:uncharacterized protein
MLSYHENMYYRKLGNTDIPVSPLGLGTLTLGPFQLDMSIDEGASLIIEAVKSGVNLIDSAKIYKTYDYIRKTLSVISPEDKKNLHIISRSYDYTYEGMKESFEEALEEIGVDKISIFMLHEQLSEQTLQGHADAIRYLQEKKTEGKLGATGISTHYVAAVEAAAEHPDIDVIFAILNKAGIGILDGTRADMEKALQKAYDNGKGILVMKALGGGHLYKNARESLEYIRSLPFVHSAIIGMQNAEELEYNMGVLVEKNNDLPSFLSSEKRRKLFIEPWCLGCENCVESCPFNALYLKDNKASVMEDRCTLCSYCARKCPELCIKVV